MTVMPMQPVQIPLDPTPVLVMMDSQAMDLLALVSIMLLYINLVDKNSSDNIVARKKVSLIYGNFFNFVRYLPAFCTSLSDTNLDMQMLLTENVLTLSQTSHFFVCQIFV